MLRGRVLFADAHSRYGRYRDVDGHWFLMLSAEELNPHRRAAFEASAQSVKFMVATTIHVAVMSPIPGIV
ncbi:hypothetical protein KSB_61610 [Ktedonobacter robiniae]|uniref:Uncharacterized protein n=1 Tax=Ktedonobacter robiniae TaxID=2778365 RepID=A0ABQ3UXV0_9CHLR|nr:hypothetical protein KSB_61610 [Ktedonobacter robiniae]